MLTRNYETKGVKMSASIIASEVVLLGYSEGWCGTEEEKDRVCDILCDYNIAYTDDMNGEYTRKENE